MKQNMGLADQIIRIVLAILIGIFYFTGQITGTAAISLMVLAAIFVLTSLIRTCPLYLPFGISTKKRSA